jgi:hypothetical protein
MNSANTLMTPHNTEGKLAYVGVFPAEFPQGIAHGQFDRFHWGWCEEHG